MTNALAILGGIPAVVTAIEACLKTAFNLYRFMKRLSNPSDIPSFQEIADRASAGALQADADMAEVQAWLDAHPE